MSGPLQWWFAATQKPQAVIPEPVTPDPDPEPDPTPTPDPNRMVWDTPGTYTWTIPTNTGKLRIYVRGGDGGRGGAGGDANNVKGANGAGSNGLAGFENRRTIQLGSGDYTAGTVLRIFVGAKGAAGGDGQDARASFASGGFYGRGGSGGAGGLGNPNGRSGEEGNGWRTGTTPDLQERQNYYLTGSTAGGLGSGGGYGPASPTPNNPPRNSSDYGVAGGGGGGGGEGGSTAVFYTINQSNNFVLRAFGGRGNNGNSGAIDRAHTSSPGNPPWGAGDGTNRDGQVIFEWGPDVT